MNIFTNIKNILTLLIGYLNCRDAFQSGIITMFHVLIAMLFVSNDPADHEREKCNLKAILKQIFKSTICVRAKYMCLW